MWCSCDCICVFTAIRKRTQIHLHINLQAKRIQKLNEMTITENADTDFRLSQNVKSTTTPWGQFLSALAVYNSK